VTGAAQVPKVRAAVVPIETLATKVPTAFAAIDISTKGGGGETVDVGTLGARGGIAQYRRDYFLAFDFNAAAFSRSALAAPPKKGRKEAKTEDEGRLTWRKT
jgi:hypothetical protein